MDDFNISPQQLAQEIGKVRLLDVREPEEFAESRIEGCTLIPLGELQVRADQELKREEDIVIYCAHGVRSMHALMALRMKGFANTRSLTGGIEAWKEYRQSQA